MPICLWLERETERNAFFWGWEDGGFPSKARGANYCGGGGAFFDINPVSMNPVGISFRGAEGKACLLGPTFSEFQTNHQDANLCTFCFGVSCFLWSRQAEQGAAKAAAREVANSSGSPIDEALPDFDPTPRAASPIDEALPDFGEMAEEEEDGGSN